ncbi:MAG: pyridoxamine 5'-phosphate oxidase family protein [Chloroflexi bacterium]|nr:pyridoxamine 5'-phosphate oxidase family protein [Chloroflexota bacterium]
MTEELKPVPDPAVRLSRLPERGSYDRATIDAILDEGYLCHVGYESDHGPVVLPTLYGRSGDFVYFHGSPAAGMFRRAKAEVDVSLTVTLVDGFVLARSLFHHSMNFRSVVAIGSAVRVEDPAEILHGLEAITENCLPGRWNEARQPNEIELRQTTVYRIELTRASAKIRTGPPGDDDEDVDLDIWAGVFPVLAGLGEPIPAPDLTSPVGLPGALESFRRFL